MFRRREGDQNAAFAKQFEDIVEQERVLERAGVKVGRDEGVMDGELLLMGWLMRNGC